MSRSHPETSKRLTIGIVCYPSIGGSGIVATQLGLELAKQGHRVHFMSYEAPFRLRGVSRNIFFHKVGINEYELFKHPDYTLPLAVTIGSVHERYGLDILHVHYAVPHATAALLACQMLSQCGTRKPPRVITTLHGTDITLLARDPNLFSIIKYSVEESSGVTAVSKSLKRDTVQVLKTRKPIEVIYNFFTPTPVTRTRQQMRRILGISESEFVGVHLSNLRPVKRIPDLLKVAAALKRTSFRLLILAGGSFEPYAPLAKQLGIEKRIIVKNNIRDIGNYISAADLGIYTSEMESFGLGLLETMAYGKPVVATAAGGIPEVVQEGRQGFLRPIGDVAGLARKVRDLMDHESLSKKLGESAKRRAEKVFSAEAVVGQYLDYYCKILKRKRS